MKELIEKLPLKMGDEAYVIRDYKGTKVIHVGKVSEMFFDENMNIRYVVKHVGRGLYGEKVFGTYVEALQKLEE